MQISVVLLIFLLLLDKILWGGGKLLQTAPCPLWKKGSSSALKTDRTSSYISLDRKSLNLDFDALFLESIENRRSYQVSK